MTNDDSDNVTQWGAKQDKWSMTVWGSEFID